MRQYNGTVDIIHDGNTYVNLDVTRYQTFVAPPSAMAILRITVKVRQTGTSAAPSIRFGLYETAGNKPVGNPLYLWEQGPNMSGGYLSTNIQVGFRWPIAPGKTYAIALTGDDDSHWQWAVAPGNENLGFGRASTSGWIDESSRGNGWMQLDVVYADPAIAVTHGGTSGFTFGSAQDQIKRYQTFFTRGGHPVSGVDLKLRKNPGSAHSDIVVTLHATASHVPDGPAIASAVIPSGAVGTAWTVVNAPLYCPGLAAYREYAIVLAQRTGSTSSYEWATFPVSKALAFGKWTGASWVPEPGLGDGWLVVWNMPEQIGSIDLVHGSSRGFGFGNVAGEIRRFQTFQLADPRAILAVDLKLRRFDGTSQSDVMVALHASDGRQPIGGALAEGWVPAAQVGTDWSIVHAPLTMHRAAAPGTYAVVLGQRAPQRARYEWAAGEVSGNASLGQWNGSAWVGEPGLGDGWMRVWSARAEVLPVDLSHGVGNGFGFGNIVDELKRFQTFTVPPLGALQQAGIVGMQVKLRRFAGTTQGDLVAELYGTGGGLPTGRPLSTAIVPAHRIGNDWTVVDVPLCDAGSLMQNGTYAVVLSQRVAQAARYEWATGPVNAAARFGKWNGQSWIDESSLGDGWLKLMLFKVDMSN